MLAKLKKEKTDRMQQVEDEDVSDQDNHPEEHYGDDPNDEPVMQEEKE
jgi:hypothetical protein